MRLFNVGDLYTISVEVQQNDYQFQLEQLFDLAARINKKRRFLFVSKVLGKHLAVAPEVPLLTSHLLAQRFLGWSVEQSCSTVQAMQTGIQAKNVLQHLRANKYRYAQPLRIIGFAETATALGGAFFENFVGDVQYAHTTREHLVDANPIITFEEEHSHATTHRLYGNPNFFIEGAHIVLVDDEMTTGITNLNIIEQLHHTFPLLTSFTLVSILDWRNEMQIQAMNNLAERLNIQIESVCIMKGSIQILDEPLLHIEELSSTIVPMDNVNIISMEQQFTSQLVKECSVYKNDEQLPANYIKNSGRFMLNTQQQNELQRQAEFVAKHLQSLRSGQRCLVIGTGEFMYMPLLIASEMGDNIKFHATTRSPILAHEQTAIHHKLTFQSPEFLHVQNYLYNIPTQYYDDIFVIFERIIDEDGLKQLVAQLQPLAQNVHVLTIGGTVYVTEYAKQLS